MHVLSYRDRIYHISYGVMEINTCTDVRTDISLAAAFNIVRSDRRLALTFSVFDEHHSTDEYKFVFIWSTDLKETAEKTFHYFFMTWMKGIHHWYLHVLPASPLS